MVKIAQPKTQVHFMVVVSIIIVKISTTPYSTPFYYYYYPLSIYAEQIQLQSPHWRYQPHFLGLCPYSPNSKLELI